jgi:Family of unknown function (DUF6069)
MTIPMRNDEPVPDPGSPRRRMDVGQLWAGGAATAVVAALIALVGILVCRWLFNIPILAPQREGAWGDASTAGYCISAAAVAIVATAIMHLLLIGTPRPTVFFGWILGLATVVAVVFPFSTTAPVSQKFATAIVNLVLGIAITSLIISVAARAVRRVTVVRRYDSYPPSRTPGNGYR